MSGIKRGIFHTCRISLFAVSTALGSTPAMSDEYSDFAAGRWVFVQKKDEFTDALTSFVAVNDRDGRGALVIRCDSVLRTGDTFIFFQINAPLQHTEYFPLGLLVRFDDQSLTTYSIKYQFGKYFTDAPKPLLDAMNGHQRLRMQIRDLGEVDLDFSLNGFSAAYDQLRPLCNK